MDITKKQVRDYGDQNDKDFDHLTLILSKFGSIEERIDSINSRLAKTETNLEWLMKAFWAVVVPLTAGLVATITIPIFH